MSSNCILAKAVFDNVAESSDELEFKQGDIVTVLEFDTGGLEGWWMCSLGNQQGIAPGNRLQLFQTEVYHTGQSNEDDVYDTPTNNSLNKLPWAEDEEYDVPTHNYNTSINNLNNNNNDPNEVYDVPTTRNWVSPNNFVSYSSPQSQNPDEIYDVPPVHSSASSQNVSMMHSLDVDQDIYDVPTNRSALDVSNFSSPDGEDVYDVPPRATPATIAMNEEEDEYDVPLSNKPANISMANSSNVSNSQFNQSVFSMISVQDELKKVEDILDEEDVVYDVPSSRLVLNNLSNKSNNASQHSILSGIHASSLQNDDEDDDFVYDVPPVHEPALNLQKQASLTSLEKMMNRLSHVSDHHSESSLDSSSSVIVSKANQYNELIIDSSSASEILIKRNQEIEDSVSHLLTLVFEGWRNSDYLPDKIQDVKYTFEKVLSAVAEFLIFAQGCFANANNNKNIFVNSLQPKHLVSGLYKLLIPIEEDYIMLTQAKSSLDKTQWNLHEISQKQDKTAGVPDDIDSFIITSRAVSDDASQMTSYIHTHMQYLFVNSYSQSPKPNMDAQSNKPSSPINQERPLPDVPSSRNSKANLNAQSPQEEDSWLEDYDYVALEDRNDVTALIESHTGHGHDGKIVDEKCKKLLDRLEHSNHHSGVPSVRISIENNHVSQTYINEMVNDVPLIIEGLLLAVKKFYRSIDQREPPKLFVSLSKQVVLCAHELVFFGDTLFKYLPKGAMQEQVKGHCTQLCSSLKQSVTATKLAALSWPSTGNVKELVQKVSNIIHCSYQFRIMLAQCTVR